jgi:thiamine pyrophosphokinase
MQTFIFLNGTIAGPKTVSKFIGKNYFIIAADGGANFLKKVNLIPDLIIGDLDSIHKSTLKFFQKRNVKINKIKEQDSTDFEKSLMFCKNNKLKDIIVFGATSTRPDHTLNNLSVLKRYYKSLNIKLITDEFEIFFIKKFIKFKYRVNEIVSLLALPEAKKIHTTGLRYRLSNESLCFGKREGALNKSISGNVSITFNSGNLLILKKHFIQ